MDPKSKVLVIDDEETITRILNKMLNKDFEVHVANDGKSALQLVQTHVFDAIVVDLVMPEIDGHEVIKRVSRVDPDIPCIVITGYSTEDNAIEALKGGAFDYLKKPLNRNLVEYSVKRAVEQRRTKNENKQLIDRLKEGRDRLRQANYLLFTEKEGQREKILSLQRELDQLKSEFTNFRLQENRLTELKIKLDVSEDLNTLLERVIEIRDFLMAHAISLYTIIKDDQGAEFVKSLIWANRLLSHTEVNELTFPMGEGYAGIVAETGEEVNAKEVQYDKRFADWYKEKVDFQIENVLCVPLRHNGKITGVIEMFNKTDPEGSIDQFGFTEQDRSMLRDLSIHISSVMDKLNLVQYDGLTGLLNREPFFEALALRMTTYRKRKDEKGFSIAIVMSDIDDFKNFNDRNSHIAGNKLLRELGRILKDSIREDDLVSRYGGEEFIFYLSKISSIEQACQFTERVRKTVEGHYFRNQEVQPNGNLTMSFGVTLLPSAAIDQYGMLRPEDLNQIVEEADKALLAAKGYHEFKGDSGRRGNRICVFDRERGDADYDRIWLYAEA
ncbi:MAG: diguanylate cyclase [Proteobacteria bacterium]|nr:diguanylate cyclase [Pseudomonadota bacterium]